MILLDAFQRKDGSSSSIHLHVDLEVPPLHEHVGRNQKCQFVNKVLFIRKMVIPRSYRKPQRLKQLLPCRLTREDINLLERTRVQVGL